MTESLNEVTTPGGRIGARIAHLVAQAVVHTRRELASTQSSIAQEVFTTATNHVSDEVRAAMGHVFQRIASSPDTPADLVPLFHHLANTRGQAFGWIGGAATGAAMSSGLGDLLTNSLAPVISTLIAENPNAYLSPEQSASIAARGISADWDNQHEAARRGVSGDRFRLLQRLGQRDLAEQSVLELFNRGVLSTDEAQAELVKGGMSHESARKLVTLAKVPLSPQEAAQAWARNLVSDQLVHLSARTAGMTNEDADVLMGLAGEPPPTEALIEAWRRGIITEQDFDRGIIQGPIRNEWIATIKALFEAVLSPQEAAAAVTQGHLTMEQALAKAKLSGVTPEDFAIIVDNAGLPPGVQFALDAMNRGVVTKEQFTAMFLESRIKNKYIDLMLAMSRQLIPAETVRIAYRLGAYPREKALETLGAHGYSVADAESLLALEDIRAREGTKELTRAQLMSLFGDDIITEAEASSMLADMGFDPIEVQWMIALEEGNKVRRFVNALVTRVRNAYVQGTMEADEAIQILTGAGIGATQRDNLLSLWDLERQSLTAQLTAAQIVAAIKKGLLDRAEGKDRLIARGYTERDAEILISLSVPA